MFIVLVGLNHKTAPVEVREKVSISKKQISDYADQLQKLEAIEGLAILSTCNRTEFYLATKEVATGVDALLEFVSAHSSFPVGDLQKHIYIKETKEAVEHLFRVAAGLDSMILGESQIQGQVQDAYNFSLEYNISNNIINTLFMNALTLGKRVRTETLIDRQPVSISSAAVELAKQKLGDLNHKTVLILGAGETSELAARHLVSNGISSVIVANRTFDRAQMLANEFGGQAIKLDQFGDYLHQADIIISCTAAPRYVIEPEHIQPVAIHRAGRPILFIDIAVPRDINPLVKEISNVFLYDIDDLQGVVAQNLEGRKKESIKAEKIIAEELEEFFFWLDSLFVIPTIVAIRKQAHEIKNKEVERAKRRIDGLTEREERIIDQLANSIINQLLHKPISNMKYFAGSKEKNIHCYIDAFEQLFELEGVVKDD